MKTTNNSVLRCVIGLIAPVMFFAAAPAAQTLRVDSVQVDSIWVNEIDSDNGRDCHISFMPRGEGTALMILSMSTDSGKTWIEATAQTTDPLSVPDYSLYTPFPTGQKATVTAHVTGGNRTGVTFKMTARQHAPVIAGNPRVAVKGPTLTPGAALQALLRIRTQGDTVTYGYSTIAKTWWDTLGIDRKRDSTTGANVTAWTWSTKVPSGAAGQQRKVVVTAIDKNGLKSPPETLTVQFGLHRAIAMKSIPAGTFSMGDAGLDESKPVHQVTLSAFTMQETPVTVEQYIAVMGTDPTALKSDAADSLTCPVGMVTWSHAVLFCNALSKLSGLDTCYTYTQTGVGNAVCNFTKKGYRLPTEAEWEYAARAGTTTPYWWGPDTIGMGASVSFDFMSGETFSKARPVATKNKNAYNVYDLVGNGWKWCYDWYGPYGATPQTNPTGAATGTTRSVRGGCWIGSMFILGDYFKSGQRDKFGPNGKARDVGFTCVVTQ